MPGGPQGMLIFRYSRVHNVDLYTTSVSSNVWRTTRDRSTTIQRCLAQLSALHREVLDLVYYHQRSVDEIAEIVGAPVSTVKKRMFYAGKCMEKLLDAV